MAENSAENAVYLDTKEKLLTIWKEVLRIEHIPVDEQFVNLGGDSLAAMLCISRLRSTFGIEFGIEEFFWDRATISEFITVIEEIRAQKIDS
jgi:acyl carrier protein